MINMDYSFRRLFSIKYLQYKNTVFKTSFMHKKNKRFPQENTVLKLD